MEDVSGQALRVYPNQNGHSVRGLPLDQGHDLLSGIQLPEPNNPEVPEFGGEVGLGYTLYLVGFRHCAGIIFVHMAKMYVITWLRANSSSLDMPFAPRDPTELDLA
jgi:hypothetical protein